MDSGSQLQVAKLAQICQRRQHPLPMEHLVVQKLVWSSLSFLHPFKKKEKKDPDSDHHQTVVLRP